MLIRNSAIYAIARLIPGLLGLATMAALTRLLEPREFGLYALALVVMSIGAMILFDWLGQSFLRFHRSQADDPEFVPTFLWLFAALAIASATALGMALIGGLVPGDLVGAYVVGLLMVWASSWFELVSRLAVAEFRPITVLSMNIARSLVGFAAATAAAWLTGNPLWTAFGAGIGIFAGALFGRVPIRRPSLCRFNSALARDVGAFGAPIAVSMALFVAIEGGARVLLERLDSAEALGLYTAAAVLAQSTIGVIAAGVASAGYSLAVRDVERGDHAAAGRQLSANGALLLAVLAPASLGIALTANGIATTILGSKFAGGAAPLIAWLSASSFLNALRASHLDHAFQLGKKSHWQIGIMGLAAMVALSLCIYLIPRQGPIGAAIAVTGAYAVAGALSLLAGRYAYPVGLPIAAAARVAVCCLTMALVVAPLPDVGWTGLALRVGLGSLTYALAAIAVNLLGARLFAVRIARAAARLRSGSSVGTALDVRS